MYLNNSIFKKYILDYDLIKNIKFDEIKEDFLKIKPLNNPIYDILSMKYIGDYIHCFKNYQKWQLYNNIDTDIIDLCKNNWPDINIDYEQILKIILDGKVQMKNIHNIKYLVLDLIDKAYKNKHSIGDNCTINSIHLQMKYLAFKLNYNQEITKIFDKNIIELNKIDVKIYEFIEEILENFKELDNNHDFIITKKILNNLEAEINKEIMIIIDEYTKEFKTYCEKLNLKNISLLISFKEQIEKNFIEKMDIVYKSHFTNTFNHLSELIILNLLELYTPSKNMHILILNTEINYDFFNIQ